MKRQTTICIIVFLICASSALAKETLDDIHLSIIKGNYQWAVAECDRRLINSQDDKLKEGLLYYRGVALLGGSDFDQARGAFLELVSKYPDSKLAERATLGAGDSYFLEGDYNSAIGIYNELAQKVPRTDIASAIYYRIAETLRNLERDDSAASALEKMNREWPLSLATKQANRIIEVEKLIYTVQVGSFLDKNNAIRLCNKLLKLEYEAYILDSLEGSRHYYRVRVGRLDSKGKAEDLARKLARRGYTTRIFP